MPRLPAVVAAAHWATKSVQMELGWPGRRSVRLHYEDMVAAPNATLRRLLAAARHAVPPDLCGPETHAVRFGVNHTVLGNPMRFRQGEMPVSLDDEWRSAMAPRAKAVVTAITAPLLVAYGYTGPRRRPGAARP
jgi:hypothetical protein